MTDENGLVLTPVSEWRNNSRRGITVQLPSGNVIRMRRTIDMMTLLRSGVLPNPLSDIFTSMLDRSTAKPEPTKMTPEALRQMDAFISDTVASCVMFPKVYKVPEGENAASWEPVDEEGISIEEFTQADRNFIFRVAQGGPTDLESFREEQKTVLASLANVQIVDDTPQPTPRARKAK